LFFGELKEIIPVAGQKQTIVVMRELKNGFVGGIFRKPYVRASRHARVLREDNANHQVHRDPIETSLGSLGHLASDEQIDLAPMVFIVGEAFVNLGLGEIRKTLRRYRIDRLSCLKKPDDVVNADSRTFHSRISAPNAG
jgi:hypothetical protein